MMTAAAPIEVTDTETPIFAPREKPLSLEFAFTDAYRKFQAAPIAQREIECLKVQFPAVMQPIQPGDLLAGRIRYALAGFSPEPMGLGFYCNENSIREVLSKEDFSKEAQIRIEEMFTFWKCETTQAKKP